MTFAFLCALMLSAVPTLAFGQPWADAFRAGEYEKAADLLHPIVSQLDRPPMSDDPKPAQYLASMYARGLGVAPDPIAACALAQLAQMAVRMGAPRYAGDLAAYHAAIKQSEQFAEAHCGQLSIEERLTASRSMGCYAFGMPEESLMVGGHTVRIGRRGIALVDTDGEKTIGLFNCPLMVARVRATSIPPPDDAVPGVEARHFVEMLFWGAHHDRRDSSIIYALHWHVYEIRGDGVRVCAMEPLHSVTTCRDRYFRRRSTRACRCR